MRKNLIVLLSLILISCAPRFMKKGTLFTYNLSRGQNLRYESKTNIKTTLELAGRVEETKTKIYLRTNQSVAAVDSLLTLVVVIDTVAIENSVNGQPVPVQSPEGLLNRSWSIKIDRTGTVKESKGLEDVELFGEGSGDIVKNYEEFLNFLPGYPLKIGDRWEMKRACENGTSISRYTFLNIEEKDGFACAKIGVKSEMSRKRMVTQGGGAVTMDIKGRGEGEIYFAEKEGLVVSYKQHFSIEGFGEVSTPLLSRPMRFPIYIDQDEATKLVK